MSDLYFYLVEVVSRCRNTQLQVSEKYTYLFNLRPNICISCLNTHFYPNNSDLIGKCTVQRALSVSSCQQNAYSKTDTQARSTSIMTLKSDQSFH